MIRREGGKKQCFLGEWVIISDSTSIVRSTAGDAHIFIVDATIDSVQRYTAIVGSNISATTSAVTEVLPQSSAAPGIVTTATLSLSFLVET